MSVIDVAHLSKRFGGRTAVEGLFFRIEAGEVFGLLGPNGAGKTTTVRMLAGLLPPSGGAASVCGFPLESQAHEVRKRVGLLTEQPGLYDRLTARENLEFHLRLHGAKKDGLGRVMPLLERFGLHDRLDEPVGRFSKGMRQKLALVRTELHSPQVLLLDEPTSGLDPESAREVRGAISSWAAEGRCIVLCSHNLNEVERLCARVAVIKSHQRSVGPVRDLRQQATLLEVTLDGMAEAHVAHLRALPFLSQVVPEQALLRLTLKEPRHVPEVVNALVAQKARILKVVFQERPLEEAYLELVSDSGDRTV